MKYKILAGICLLTVSWTVQEARGVAGVEPLDFKEVYDLLRTNLTGVDAAGLNRAAVNGLLSQLDPQVSLVGEPAGAAAGTNAPGRVKTAIFEGAFGYIRVGPVGPGMDQQLKNAYQELAATNRLKGLVIDLRFSGGQDYAAAASMADFFFSKEQPMIDWGEGLKKSTPKEKAWALPLTILVNKKTSGAAEAFAGILRQAEIGLLIGSDTAGRASIAKEFELKNGQRLRIATAPVKVGDAKPMPAEGMRPDIRVEVASEDERAHLEDAFRPLEKAGAGARIRAAAPNQLSDGVTNRSPRRRINEADLVRMTREGQNPDADTNSVTAKELDGSKPFIQDPALARAIDLLKGLAVVQQFRPM